MNSIMYPDGVPSDSPGDQGLMMGRITYPTTGDPVQYSKEAVHHHLTQLPRQPHYKIVARTLKRAEHFAKMLDFKDRSWLFAPSELYLNSCPYGAKVYICEPEEIVGLETIKLKCRQHGLSVLIVEEYH